MQLSQLIDSQRLMRGGEIAAIDGGVRRTWNETADRISRLATGLVGLGVEPGDRVAILALNSHRYLEAVFAIAWVGAVMVPLNTRLAPPEIKFMLDDAGAKVIFADDNFVELSTSLQQELEQLKQVIHVADGAGAPKTHAFETLIADSSPMAALRLAGDELAGLFYTGGTTGRSKGVMLSHDNLMINTLQSSAVYNYGGGKKYLHAAPMFHAADFIGMLMHLARGGPHVFIPGFEPVAVMETIAAEGVNVVLLIPAMIGMVVNHPAIGDYDLSSVELITYGGSPISEGLLKRTVEVLPNVDMVQAYGQTELSPVLTILDPDGHRPREGQSSKIRSGGRPIPGCEIAILDENDEELATGEIGEICARGPNVMMGYWRLPELTDETLRNGWLHTGDGGYLDEDGFVFVVDRVKDMIVSGGENVYSSEVESAISQFDGIIECAVIGIPSERWGEKVHAEVRLREGVEASAEDIISHCHTLIAGFKCPKSLNIRTEPLPLSGAGKVMKRELREPFWKGKEKAVS